MLGKQVDLKLLIVPQNICTYIDFNLPAICTYVWECLEKYVFDFLIIINKGHNGMDKKVYSVYTIRIVITNKLT